MLLSIIFMAKQRIVVIGGGFGGLKLARALDKKQYEVVIVDRNNYHSFPPLFYQVASSGLEPASISFPLRREVRGRRYKGCSFHLGEVGSIDVERKVVVTQYEEIPYDRLVIACGTTNNFFGIEGLAESVVTLKSTSEAIRVRNKVLARLERAALLPPGEERRSLLTFVVVGGGPAGVEMAGALGEMKRFVIKREYPTISPDEVRVILAEGSGVLLASMGARSSADAEKGLRQLLVDIWLGKQLKSYRHGVTQFADGQLLNASTVIWTAGVTGVPFELRGSEVEPGPGRRFIVDEYNAVRGMTDVYAIGDIALMMSEKYPKGHPQLAQVALQQGENLARNLNGGSERHPFVYRNFGTMATIGRNRAVADVGKFHLSGRLAWAAWLFVHLRSILGMRNRTVVFINWMWNYFTFSAGLRLLLKQQQRPR